MATPTTHIEIDLMMQQFNQNIDSFRNKICEAFYVPLYRMIYDITQPAKPHTDDMIQMLEDLGIEQKEPIDFKSTTFRWH